jgi:MFS transporter, ACS family, D-galactonate transporter
MIGISSTRKWLAVSLLFLAILINYVDRGNLSIAAVPLMRDFGISPAAMGALLSAFFWSYSLLQIPAGYAVDRFGLKGAYAGAFLLWSLASAAIGLAGSFRQILILRLLLGVGETVAHPASISFIRRNFSDEQQGLPTAIYLSGMQFGPAAGAFLGSAILVRTGWRLLFVLTGLVACAWLVPWIALAPREPTAKIEHPVTRARPLVWRALFATPLVPGILIGAFFYSYYWYYCLTWLPSYLVMTRGFSFLRMGVFTAVPLTAMAIVSITASRVADRLIARVGRAMLIRKIFVVMGFLLGSSILVLPLVASAPAVMAALLCSLSGIGVASANYWALTQTISPRAMIGRIIGCQNTIANLAGICAPMLTGLLVGRATRFELSNALAGLSLWVAAAAFLLLVRERDAQTLHQQFGTA